MTGGRTDDTIKIGVGDVRIWTPLYSMFTNLLPCEGQVTAWIWALEPGWKREYQLRIEGVETTPLCLPFVYLVTRTA